MNETGSLKTQTLSYDANGNRTGDGQGSYTYLPNSNLLLTAHGINITKDAAGNITGDGVFTFVYNQAGQVRQVLKGLTPVANYGYDYRGLRVRKTVGVRWL